MKYKEWFNSQIEHYPGARKDVLHFIGKLVSCRSDEFSNSSRVIEKLFASGYCYYFALMLKQNFGGSVVWHYQHSHILWIDENDIVYDVYGVFEDYDLDDIVPVELLGEKGLNSFLHLETEYKITKEEKKEIINNVECFKRNKRSAVNMSNSYEESCKMREKEKTEFKEKLKEFSNNNGEVSLCTDGTYLDTERISKVIDKVSRAYDKQMKTKDCYSSLYVADYAVILTALEYIECIAKKSEPSVPKKEDTDLFEIIS